jgi:serine/threonine-protein kinase/endoribonuclease IRE1
MALVSKIKLACLDGMLCMLFLWCSWHSTLHAFFYSITRLLTSITSQYIAGFGSSGWQAPEQLRHESQTRAMDLFSLGCLIFYCITKGKHPFGEYYERDMNIIKGNFDLFVVDHIPEAVHLISQLLQPKPEDR